MRVVVTGASGNVGTSLLRALGKDDGVEEIVGLARRLPLRNLHETEWRADAEGEPTPPLETARR